MGKPSKGYGNINSEGGLTGDRAVSRHTDTYKCSDFYNVGASMLTGNSPPCLPPAFSTLPTPSLLWSHIPQATSLGYSARAEGVFQDLACAPSLIGLYLSMISYWIFWLWSLLGGWVSSEWEEEGKAWGRKEQCKRERPCVWKSLKFKIRGQSRNGWVSLGGSDDDGKNITQTVPWHYALALKSTIV